MDQDLPRRLLLTTNVVVFAQIQIIIIPFDIKIYNPSNGFINIYILTMKCQINNIKHF